MNIYENDVAAYRIYSILGSNWYDYSDDSCRQCFYKYLHDYIVFTYWI